MRLGEVVFIRRTAAVGLKRRKWLSSPRPRRVPRPPQITAAVVITLYRPFLQLTFTRSLVEGIFEIPSVDIVLQ